MKASLFKYLTVSLNLLAAAGLTVYMSGCSESSDEPDNKVVENNSGRLDPKDIKDYSKYICPSQWNEHFEKGPDYMLRKDSYYSWHRCKQSEHFFVFWSPEFGDDPNGKNVPANMRVNIDELLAQAEKFFDSNVNKLKMATLGQDKSMLDNYKMQIYLIYQDEWLATGSGYDDSIGALWVNPSTCQPVASTIAHEIAHSFQYQTYADRVRKQGASNDYKSGFRYGFVGPDRSGNDGCVYWEQCAQWQAHMDYPEEQFDSYHYGVWLNNCHRHFHHEWMRYASYWLQSYWVEKRGIEVYGRIWKESVMPEDAIMAYSRLYNDNDYSKTRDELYDYAARMATFDIDNVREYAGGYQDRYRTSMIRNSDGAYQVTYASCPGATGFNVIALEVPQNGGTVSVEFKGLKYGATLNPKDPGKILDGDNVVKGTVSRYNMAGGAENMGWRYGFVARTGEKRTYGEAGTAADGTLSFNVPAGTEYLYLVVQGSPEKYMSHGWDDRGENDAQFPYTIKLNGTDLKYYEPPLEASYAEEKEFLSGTLDVSVSSSNEDWVFGTYDINEERVRQYFGLSKDEFAKALVVPTVGNKVEAMEGKIVVFNENSDGKLNGNPTANFGYWLDKKGNVVNWGAGHLVYYEFDGTVLQLGKLGAEAGVKGDVFTLRPVLVYTKDGKQKTLKYKITYRFK